MMFNEFDSASVRLFRNPRPDSPYSFENMRAWSPNNPVIDAASGWDEVPEKEPEPVICLSCGGTFVRSADGSIPCGH